MSPRRSWWAEPVVVTRRLLIFGFLVPYLLIGLTMGALYETNGNRIHDLQVAACRDKSNAVRQLEDTYDYLREHPNGAPGIPRSLIIRGIGNQRQALRELSSVHCDAKLETRADRILARPVPPAEP